MTIAASSTELLFAGLLLLATTVSLIYLHPRPQHKKERQMTINKLTTAMTLPRSPKQSAVKIHWNRIGFIAALVIGAAFCAVKAATAYDDAFAIYLSAQQSTMYLQQATLFAITAGFHALAAVIIVIFKPPAETGEPRHDN